MDENTIEKHDGLLTCVLRGRTGHQGDRPKLVGRKTERRRGENDPVTAPAGLTGFAVLVGRMIVQVGGLEQLVDETVRVYPGFEHAGGGLREAVIGHAPCRQGRLLVAPLQRRFAAVQRTGLDAAEHGRRLARGGHGRAARRETVQTEQRAPVKTTNRAVQSNTQQQQQ